MSVSHKPRMLFLTDVMLRPVDRGNRVRVSGLLEACANVFSVTLVAPKPPHEADQATLESQLDGCCWVQDDAHPISLKTWFKAWRVAPGLKRLHNVRHYARYLAALESLNLRDYELIWAERLSMASLCKGLEHKTLLDLDDIEHRKFAAQLRHVADLGGLQRLKLHYRKALYQRLEIQSAKRFATTVVCSELDRDYLRSQDAEKVLVVPNGASNAPADPLANDWILAPHPDGPLKLVFLGHLNHLPNQDAIDYFIAQILPRLKQFDPATRFDIIGAYEDGALASRYAKHATLRGYVENLGQALTDYDVLVAPVRYGGGTRLKILDAMACGVPVVTTTPGAEGLALTHQTHALLADSAEAFADAVIAIKQSRELARSLSGHAASLIQERYLKATIQSELQDWLVRFLQRAR